MTYCLKNGLFSAFDAGKIGWVIVCGKNSFLSGVLDLNSGLLNGFNFSSFFVAGNKGWCCYSFFVKIEKGLDPVEVFGKLLDLPVCDEEGNSYTLPVVDDDGKSDIFIFL